MSAQANTKSIRAFVVGVLALALFAASGATAQATEPLTFTTVGAPTITGTAAVGETLSATFDASTVEPAADSAMLTWFVDGVDVGNGDSLGLHPADVGKVITVRLTVLKAGYTNGTADSAPTAAVVKGTQVFTPAISGIAAVGKTLSVTNLPEDSTFTYRWKRSGASISGGTGATYKLTTTDVGKTVTVTVTSTRAGYNTVAKTSAPTAAVKKVFTKSYTPVVSGTAKVGYTLTAKTTAWSPTATLKYQWYRNGVAISGATATTRKLSSLDAGAIITVKVTGSKSGYLTVVKTSAPTAVIAKGSITAAAPVISGTARAGSTLKASLGTISPSTVSKTIQWYRNGVAVAGATTSTYALKNVDAGKKFTVKVTYAITGYNTKTLTSAATATIATRAASFGNGTFRVGRDISAGTYLQTGSSCYWARLSGPDDFDDIIANDFGGGRQIVTIDPTDIYFESSGCSSWILWDGTGNLRSTVSSDGVYAVGVEVRTGEYVAYPTDSCYVASLSGASDRIDQIIANEFTSDADILYWNITDETQFFETSGCGTWTRIGDVPATP